MLLAYILSINIRYEHDIVKTKLLTSTHKRGVQGAKALCREREGVPRFHISLSGRRPDNRGMSGVRKLNITVLLKNTAHFARYVRGIFANQDNERSIKREFKFDYI